MAPPRNGLADALREAIAGAPSMQAPADRPEDDSVVETDSEDDVPQGEQPEEDISAGEQEQEQEIAGDDEEIRSINDLPQAMGWSAEEFYSLPIKLAENQDPVPLGEIKDKLQQFDEERSKFDEEKQVLVQEIERAKSAPTAPIQQAPFNDEMIEAAGTMKLLEAQWPKLEEVWKQTEASDPGRVALEKQNVSQEYAAARARYDNAQRQQHGLMAQQRNSWNQQQHQVMLKAIPEWSDDVKRREMQDKLANFAQRRYGVPRGQLANVDALTVIMLNDALIGAEAREKAAATFKAAPAGGKSIPKGLRVKKKHKSESPQPENRNRRGGRSRQNMTQQVKDILGG